MKYNYKIKFITVLLLIITSSYAVAKTTIYDTRFWDSPDKTRIVIDISKVSAYKITKHKNNQRIYITISNVNFLKKAFLSIKKYQDTRIKNIFSHRKKSKLILDIELKKPLRINYFSLKPNKIYKYNRLVIDLYDKKLATKIIKTASNKKIIVIDAGHGGEDPGAIGYYKTYEKNITLKLAKQLAKKINKLPNYKAFLTRRGDYYVSLLNRIKLSQKANADLFISIHADSVSNKNARGSSVYTLSLKGANTRFVRQLEERENTADKFGGIDAIINNDKNLNKILWDFSRKDTDKQSYKLANSILQQLKKIAKLHKKKPQKAGFVVLKTPAIPSILIETAFISNPKDERRLNSIKEQKKIINAIMTGIINYYN